MPMSNYPQGFANGLSVRGLPLLQTNPGSTFWVGNFPLVLANNSGAVGGADGNSGTFQKPFATLQRALDLCQNGPGDIIMIKPGHREAISSATVAILNKAGVAIVGLGVGNLRPTFIFGTAATANIPLRASGLSIQNCLFIANFADIASMFTAISASVTAAIALDVMTVSAVGSGTLYPGATLAGTGVFANTLILSQISGTTGGVGTYRVSVSGTVASTTITTITPDFALENCEFRDTSSILNALTIVTGSAAVNSLDGFRFSRNRVSSLGTTAATTAIVLSTATARMQITDNFGASAVLNDTAAILAAGAAQLTDFQFSGNVWERPNTSSTGGSFISGSGNAWTGQAFDNYLYQVDNTAGIWISTGHGSSFGYSQNFSPITGAVDRSGLINPAAV